MVIFRGGLIYGFLAFFSGSRGRLLKNLVKEWAAAHRPLAVEHDYPPEDHNISLYDEL